MKSHQLYITLLICLIALIACSDSSQEGKTKEDPSSQAAKSSPAAGKPPPAAETVSQPPADPQGVVQPSVKPESEPITPATPEPEVAAKPPTPQKPVMPSAPKPVVVVKPPPQPTIVAKAPQEIEAVVQTPAEPEPAAPPVSEPEVAVKPPQKPEPKAVTPASEGKKSESSSPGKKTSGVCPQPRKTKSAPSNIARMDKSGSANADNGKKIYDKTAKPMACKMCHGAKGDGKGKLGAALKPNPRNFTCAETMKKVSVGQMFWIIKNGSVGTSMIAHKKTLKDKDIWDVVKYIRSTYVN